MAFFTPPGWWRHGQSREIPIFRLSLYYGALVGVAALAIVIVPEIRHALLAPIQMGGAESLFSGDPVPVPPVDPAVPPAAPQRGITTLIVTIGALLVTLPIAWVYMYTRRLRYDPSLVQSVVILPIVVAGIVIVVKNSLALAFSLAGIVAAVRFRNTLKDPKDAVYVFLALGIGLAAGVQALDIALVMSFTFNVLVLMLWKYNIGSIYSGVSAKRSVLSVGNKKLMTVRNHLDRDRIRTAVAEMEGEHDSDGVLLVHTSDADAARRGLEVSLSRLASEWKLLETSDGERGTKTLTVLVELRKKVDPAEMLGELDDRWTPYIAAAEFVSLRTHEVSWDGRERRDSPAR